VSKRRDRPYQAGQVEALGQGQESAASGDEPGDGSVRVSCQRSLLRDRGATRIDLSAI
jgi:hypothetical protein